MNRYTTVMMALAFGILASPVFLMAQEAEGEGGSLFSINFGLMAWTVVVFLGLLFILAKWAWGPILQAVDSREEGIREALDEAAQRQAEARELADEQRKQLADARRQAQEIIAEGRDAGQQVRREIEEKAQEEGKILLERARKEIDREKDAALDEIRRESVEIALAAASRLLQQKVDDPMDRDLVLGYVADLAGAGKEAGVEA